MRNVVFLVFAAVAASTLAEVRLEPMPRVMKYGDTSRYGEGRPFAKDPTVIHRGGRYLMYYSVPAYPAERRPKGYADKWCMAVAASTNLVDWTRVGDLNVGRNGSAAPCVKVIRGKIHLFYQSYGIGPNDAIHHATSEDGITFTDDPSNPVFAPKAKWSCGRAIDAEVYPAGDRLVMLCATRDPSRKIQELSMASAPLDSDYGRASWKELSVDGPVLKPELPWEGQCIEAPTVISRDGTWYLFYAGAYNNWPQQIGLATSKDGVHFTRASDKPVYANGKPGEWNASESGHPGVFEDNDGQIYLFYQGNRTRGRDWFLSVLKVTL
jgi:predicted GH43/DUF377 family glycosyl hydrolase